MGGKSPRGTALHAPTTPWGETPHAPHRREVGRTHSDLWLADTLDVNPHWIQRIDKQ
jgi:hypothetical protein